MRTIIMRSRTRQVAAAVAIAVALSGLGTGIAAATSSSSPTFGVIPSSAMTANGVDWSQAPDYVVLWGSGHTVQGYIPKGDLETPPGTGQGPLNGGTYMPTAAQAMPVYNQQQVLIGHLYPTAGYVPLGGPVPSASQMTPTTFVGPSSNQ